MEQTASSSSTNGPLCVIMLRGLPGIGKTTLAKALAKELKYPLVCKDDFRDVMFDIETEVNTKLHLSGSSDTIDLNGTSYDGMIAVATTQLQCGMSVILESPLGTRERYDRFCDLAKRFDATPVTIDCFMGWKARLLHRKEKGTEPAHKPHDPEKILDYYRDKMTFKLDRGPCLSLDMTGSEASLVRTTLAWFCEIAS